MKPSLLASTALTTSTALVTGAALAADMPVKAPPRLPTLIPFSWTGCYIGGNAGWAGTSIKQSAVVPLVDLSGTAYDSSGRENSFIGGGQVGCSWQFDPRWVIGLEGQFDWLKASRTVPFGGESTIRGSQTTGIRWLTTVLAQFGYAWDRAMLYAAGGVAIGRVTSSVAASDPGDVYAGADSSTQTGWAAGVGFKYAFTDRIFGTLEYLHFDLGNTSFLVSGGVGRPRSWLANSDVSGDTVRVGLDFKLTP